MVSIQMFGLALGGTMCFIIAVFSLLIQYRNKNRKAVLFLMELSTAIMMFADVCTLKYNGDTSTLGFVITYISNFLVFFLIYTQLLLLYLYIDTYLTKHKDPKYSKYERYIIIAAVAVAVLQLVISQFNGMYYSIDSNNVYSRGPVFFGAYIVPVSLSLYYFIKTIKNRMHLTPYIVIANVVFTTLPVVCGIAQGLMDGTSLFDMSMSVSMVIMFALSLVNHNAYLSHIARIDRVTRLYNGYGFVLKIEEKIAKNEISKYNAFYIDIARMGLVNRKYGNLAGNEIILNYSKILKSSLEEGEVLGRLGGNFFVALVRKDNTDKFLDLLAGTDVPFRNAEGEKSIKVSSVVGAYEIPDGKLDGDQIMANISMAVSIAKNVKKKPVVFLTKEIMQEFTEDRQLQQMLPMYMKNGEFKAYYQPKVNQHTNTLCGAEALSRWEHEGEVLSPFRFIPLMEQNDFICKFDMYMLECVCADLKKWIDEGLTPPVISVNFSRRNLGNTNLADDIYNIVKKYNIPPSLIQIEVTETVDEYPLSTLRDVVIELEKRGMTTAIDDFGTGSSSIKLLMEVPFDVLKIDKSFIDSITNKNRTFISYIIGMAQTMGAKVITEGVETHEQLEVLAELGCYEVQGYYFDKPLSRDVFEERLKNPKYER